LRRWRTPTPVATATETDDFAAADLPVGRMTKRIGVATGAYLGLMSLLVVSPLAEVGGVVTAPPMGIVVAATLLIAHIGYGAATRTLLGVRSLPPAPDRAARTCGVGATGQRHT